MVRICDRCKKESNKLKSIRLFGVHDFYDLELCDSCIGFMCDHFTPEEVDEIFK